MTKRELERGVAGARGRSAREVHVVVDELLRSIARALSEGHSVTLRSFGRFPGAVDRLPGRQIPRLPPCVLVGREQGLIVRKGNPKGIKSLEDLSRPKSEEEAGRVQFVNRQRGAGTRVLLDYHLTLLGIVPDAIVGYTQEEYTHLGVAAAVASGRADCGLGIAAAAQALDLDFIPLFQERYDLVIPKEHAESELLAPLFELLDGREFREAVSQLKGYHTDVMGKVILED